MVKSLFRNKLLIITAMSVILVSAVSIPFIIKYLDFNDSLSICDNADICIDSDGDFEYYSFKGNGSKENPYLIENQIFENHSQTGISIKSTTKFVIIKNCSFNNGFFFSIEIQNARAETVKISSFPSLNTRLLSFIPNKVFVFISILLII